MPAPGCREGGPDRAPDPGAGEETQKAGVDGAGCVVAGLPSANVVGIAGAGASAIGMGLAVAGTDAPVAGGTAVGTGTGFLPDPGAGLGVSAGPQAGSGAAAWQEPGLAPDTGDVTGSGHGSWLLISSRTLAGSEQGASFRALATGQTVPGAGGVRAQGHLGGPTGADRSGASATGSAPSLPAAPAVPGVAGETGPVSIAAPGSAPAAPAPAAARVPDASLARGSANGDRDGHVIAAVSRSGTPGDGPGAVPATQGSPTVRNARNSQGSERPAGVSSAGQATVPLPGGGGDSVHFATAKRDADLNSQPPEEAAVARSVAPPPGWTPGGSGSPTEGTRQVPVGWVGTGSAGPVPASEWHKAVEGWVQQVEWHRQGERHELRLHLIPDHLGPLHVELSHEAAGLHARITVGHAEALILIQKHQEDLRQALQAQGYELARLDVNLAAGQDAGRHGRSWGERGTGAGSSHAGGMAAPWDAPTLPGARVAAVTGWKPGHAAVLDIRV